MDTRMFRRSFKALGDTTRLEILRVLSGGELTVSAIAERIGCAQPTASRHLAILREADIVIDRRDGQRIFYRLNKTAVGDCCTGFCDCLMVPAPKGKKNKKK